ncbi:hypothetical protein ABPG74_022734 [Tetrahymena malaccensis]
MCITFFFIDRNPDAKLKFVMVHNREEDFARPTLQLGQFEEDLNIYGGRDEKEKGTWLGFNAKTQNLAFLTNRFSWSIFKDRMISKINFFSKTGEQKTISRGKLIQEFISTDFFERYQFQNDENSTYNYAKTIFQNRNKFMPFNLLVANLKHMEFVFQGNYDKFPPVSLRDGYHTFCNFSSFESPIQKQVVGLNRFKELVQQTISNFEDNNATKIQKDNEKGLIQNIHDIMENEQYQYTFSLLPMWNESKIFIKPYYSYFNRHYRGTRTSTVLILNDKNLLTVSENTYHQDTNIQKVNKQYEIQL